MFKFIKIKHKPMGRRVYLTIPLFEISMSNMALSEHLDDLGCVA